MHHHLSQPSVRVFVAIMGGGLVHSVLPLGMFGRHDMLYRALLTGAATALVAVVLQVASP